MANKIITAQFMHGVYQTIVIDSSQSASYSVCEVIQRLKTFFNLISVPSCSACRWWGLTQAGNLQSQKQALTIQ